MKRLLHLVGLFCVAGLVASTDAVGSPADTVARWSARGNRLGLPQGRRVRQVVPHDVDGRTAALHEVRFEGGGFAVTAGDDSDAGVLAFAADGELVESGENPLWILLCRHVSRAGGRFTSVSLKGSSASSVSELRVAPLVRSRWDQSTAAGGRCYNYYTPNGYVCGCVATAMAQVMRYHAWPPEPLVCETNACKVGSVATNLTMRGGPYDWAAMPYVPGSGHTESNREAIGRLTYDCGVANHMQYASGGSAAYGGVQHLPLKQVFDYASAESINAESGESLDAASCQNAILANLDLRSPVMLGICKCDPTTKMPTNGHAIVADGYGYVDGVCYVHLNMGWSGSSDAWYALPDIGTSYGFNVVDATTYNVFPRAAGAIVSGHVTADGTNVVGASVAFLTPGGACVTNVVTDTNGVYAALVAERTSYRIVLSVEDVALTNSVQTGRSASIVEFDWDEGTGSYAETPACGNRWGVDFDLTPEPEPEPAVLHVSVDGDDATGTGTASAPFATIGAALAAATQEGTIVEVGPGTYTGCVTAVSLVKEIRSSDGPEMTILDADWSGGCFDASASKTAQISGFTLQHGYETVGAGAYYGVVSNCIIRSCLAERTNNRNGAGGGAYGATLTDTYLYGNEAGNYGGGAAACTLVRCTVFGNWSYSGSGVDGDTACSDSIVWGNEHLTTGATDNWETYRTWGQTKSTAFYTSCTTPLPTTGSDNITDDPQFVSADDADFRLRTGSPCLGTGSDGGNRGAWQGAGVAGFKISVTTVGPGSVTPAAAVLAPGESVTFEASDHHPFLGYETNGVFITSDTSLTFSDPQQDLTLTARFANTNFFVDAATGDDARDGWSWATAKRTLGATVDTVASGERVTVGPGTYDGFTSYATDVEIVSRDGASATVIDARGGALCFDDEGQTTLRGFSLVNAVADGYSGGGAYGGRLVDCVISNCTAATGGGAAHAELEGCVIAFNSAANQGGGAAACRLSGCTVYGNRAGAVRSSRSTLAGGGVDCQCVCTNTIVWGNVNATNATDNWEAYVVWSTTVPILDHVCTEPWISTGVGMVYADPKMVRPANGDFRLAEISPCLGAGVGGANIGAFDGAGVVLTIPELPTNPSAADVAAAAASVGCADPRATAFMGASAANYTDFRAWAATVGTTAAVLAKRSCLSYEIRALVATPGLLSDADEVRFEIPGLEPSTETDGWTATAKLVDGTRTVPLTTAKAAFANVLRVGTEPQTLRPATVDDILSTAAGEAGEVRLTIRPPSAACGFFGLSL